MGEVQRETREQKLERLLREMMKGNPLRPLPISSDSYASVWVETWREAEEVLSAGVASEHAAARAAATQAEALTKEDQCAELAITPNVHTAISNGTHGQHAKATGTIKSDVQTVDSSPSGNDDESWKSLIVVDGKKFVSLWEAGKVLLERIAKSQAAAQFDGDIPDPGYTESAKYAYRHGFKDGWTRCASSEMGAAATQGQGDATAEEAQVWRWQNMPDPEMCHMEAKDLYALMAGFANYKLGAQSATPPAKDAPKWISPRTDLPDEDVLVLVAVDCETDDHDGVTQRWPEVHEATMYRAGCQLIASTVADGEYQDEEILGWMPLPEPPAQPAGSTPETPKEPR